MGVDDAHAPIVNRVSLAWSKALLFREMHGESLIECHQFPADRLVADASAADLIDTHTRVIGGRDADRMYFNDTRKTIVTKFKANP